MWGMNPFGDLFIGIIGVVFIWFVVYVISFIKETRYND